MDEGSLQTMPRLTNAAAGVAYVVVFMVTLGDGAPAEVALVRGIAAMLGLGLLGNAILALVGAWTSSGEGR